MINSSFIRLLDNLLKGCNRTCCAEYEPGFGLAETVGAGVKTRRILTVKKILVQDLKKTSGRVAFATESAWILKREISFLTLAESGRLQPCLFLSAWFVW